MATLADNAATGGYDAYLEVTIKGSGIATGLGNMEKENSKNFILGQNFPNPYARETNIPFHLIQTADVTLALYDLQGKKITTISKSNLPAGDHLIPLDMNTLEVPVGNYVYQLEVKNSNGIYHDCKMMTAAQ